MQKASSLGTWGGPQRAAAVVRYRSSSCRSKLQVCRVCFIQNSAGFLWVQAAIKVRLLVPYG